MRIAVTGGTGFIGGHLLNSALAAGHSLRALTRRPQQAREGIEWVSGSLSDRGSLERLVSDADAVIHIAGAINAPDWAAFETANVGGTLAMLASATASGVRRFVHVSSLAAREPGISAYGASKARSEELVSDSGLDWAIVRPPAVYGPGDRETLDLFRMARSGLVLLPPKGRISLIQVEDLARLLLALAERSAPSKIIVEPDDGRSGGWSHREFASALGKAVGKRGVALSAPGLLLRLGARLDRLLRRDKAKLTPDRAAYFCHPDWVASADRRVPDRLWRPQVDTQDGLSRTANWYKSQGWL